MSTRYRYQVDSVDLAATLMESFTRDRSEMTLDEIKSVLGVSSKRASRMAAVLVSSGLLAGEPATCRYSLGLGWLRLKDIRKGQVDIREVALPILKEIQRRTKETVSLNVRAGLRRVSVDFVESVHSVRRIAQPGFEAPLYAGASGRVLLAGMDDSFINDYLEKIEMTPLTTHTVVDKSALWESIHKIRKSGYAVSVSEVNDGIAAVSAPIKDHSGNTVAAVAISFPRERFTQSARRTFVACLVENSCRLSELNGFAKRKVSPARTKR